MTLKARITLVTAVLIAIASTTIGVSSYISISNAQLNAIDSTLENVLGGTPRRTLERVSTRPADERDRFFSPFGIAVLNDSGDLAVIRPAGNASDPDAFPTIPVAELRASRSEPTTISDPLTEIQYRLINRPLGRGLNAVVVTSLEDYNNTMNQIMVSIILFALGVTGLGAMGSWLIVRRFFRPVDAMIAAAGAIAQGDTSRRVPDAMAGTELGDLSTSLNSMINSLTKSIERVEKSEESLRAFVSNASHEIRTPLTVIRGYAEILMSQNSFTSDAEKRALERLDSESRRLERLVTSLLALEARENAAPSHITFRLDQLISHHFIDLEAISHRPVTQDLEAIEINGDPDSWEQLLGNLTQNIDRYTPEGSAVSVSLKQTTHEGKRFAVLTINDSGPGIPANMRTEIFARFTRLDLSRSTETGGFGLGMSIVKAVVESHGGLIELGESPQGGLQIVISVPCI